MKEKTTNLWKLVLISQIFSATILVECIAWGQSNVKRADQNFLKHILANQLQMLPEMIFATNNQNNNSKKVFPGSIVKQKLTNVPVFAWMTKKIKFCWCWDTTGLSINRTNGNVRRSWMKRTNTRKCKSGCRCERAREIWWLSLNEDDEGDDRIEWWLMVCVCVLSSCNRKSRVVLMMIWTIIWPSNWWKKVLRWMMRLGHHYTQVFC